ncbi:MAG TPA: glycosyltransferase family 39 protein [Oxalicibacterium sp.]|jgi:4-amino-4-deoxy-L-arabinose transferase-like glycosyltransferase|nr:glycosyltransferase family 39 protein [Oxalicibacterium sp.]
MQQSHLDLDQERAGRIFLLLVAVYFILHIVIRVTLTDSLAMDESEQALAYAHLQLGYGTQPPLYSWLQWLTFSTFGFNVFSFALLKNVILFALYAGLFVLARPLIGVGGAITASASMLLMPEIAWESQRDLTHTVLLTAIVCWTLCCYFAMLRKPATWRYALFGLLIGLGLLSKYNYTVFIGGLACASLAVREHRQIIWNNRIWLAAIVALLCILPHSLWLLTHLDAASDGTLAKMREGVTHSYFDNLLRGFGSMVWGAIGFLTPLWVVYLLCGWRAFRHPTIARRDTSIRFFLWLYAAFFMLMCVILLTGHISNIKGRWLQQLLFPLPMLCFLLLPALARNEVYRKILRVVAVLALLILIGIPLRVQLGPYLDKYSRSHYPYPQLSAELEQRFPRANTLIVGEKLTGGNLYFQRPSMRTFILDRFLAHPERLDGRILFVTPSAMREGQLESLLRVFPAATIAAQGQLQIPYQKSRGEKMAFDYALIDIAGS